MIKIGDYAIDLRSLVGVAVAILGWIVGNSAVIIPTLPPSYQPIFGNIVVLAGLILNILAHAPYQISKTITLAGSGPGLQNDSEELTS